MQSNTCRSLARTLTRAFSASSAAPAAQATSASADAPSSSRRPQVRRQPLGAYNLKNLEAFNFDDTTSLGFMRLVKIREAQELFRKVEMDREALKRERKPFKPPANAIRITSTIDLSNPTSPCHVKQVLLAPVSSLPLQTPGAIHRLKLLAGPRWTPGMPGRDELERQPEGEHEGEGYVRISEERFPDSSMNRKSAGDMLERLVAAANDPASPLPAALPLDERHLLARQRKKRQRSAAHVVRRAEAIKARPEVIGGVRGFPKEWLGSAMTA